MEEKFSPEDSLMLIRTMIDKTKDSVADKSFYFLLWGWLVFTACIMQFVLKVFIQFPMHWIGWNLLFLGVIVSFYRAVKEGKKRVVTTYIDESLGYTWISIFITQMVFVFVFAYRGNWEYSYTFFILLYAIGCFITGKIISFPPLVRGALGCWVLAIISTFTPFDYNILLCALAILISYIIPGYLLRMNFKKQS
jgi:hypothetical protein